VYLMTDLLLVRPNCTGVLYFYKKIFYVITFIIAVNHSYLIQRQNNTQAETMEETHKVLHILK